MATKTKRARKPRQKLIPGTDDLSIPDLDNAITDYVDVRDKRMELTKEEVESRGRVAELLKENKLTEYRFDGQVARLIQGEPKIKVSKVDAPDSAEVEDEGEA